MYRSVILDYSEKSYFVKQMSIFYTFMNTAGLYLKKKKSINNNFCNKKDQKFM